MGVVTKTQPDSGSQVGGTYKSAIDKSISVIGEVGGQWAPHEKLVPDLTMLVDAGRLISAQSLVTQAQQTVTGFTATGANQRIDRVVVNVLTGAVSRVIGTQSATPVAPIIPAGFMPICQVGPFTTTTTQITNSMITDERVLVPATDYFGGIGILTDAASIAWDTAAKPVAEVTLGASGHTLLPSNLIDGRRYTCWIIQDGVGGRTIVFDSSIFFPLGVDTSLIDTTAGAINILEGTARAGKLHASLGKGMA